MNRMMMEAAGYGVLTARAALEAQAGLRAGIREWWRGLPGPSLVERGREGVERLLAGMGERDRGLFKVALGVGKKDRELRPAGKLPKIWESVDKPGLRQSTGKK